MATWLVAFGPVHYNAHQSSYPPHDHVVLHVATCMHLYMHAPAAHMSHNSTLVIHHDTYSSLYLACYLHYTDIEFRMEARGSHRRLVQTEVFEFSLPAEPIEFLNC